MNLTGQRICLVQSGLCIEVFGGFTVRKGHSKWLNCAEVFWYSGRICRCAISFESNCELSFSPSVSLSLYFSLGFSSTERYHCHFLFSRNRKQLELEALSSNKTVSSSGILIHHNKWMITAVHDENGSRHKEVTCTVGVTTLFLH